MNNDMIPVGTTVHINPEDIKWEWNGGDLISREALKKVISELPDDNPSYYYPRCLLERQKVLDAIDNAPTVEERPQGEWITHITYFECSNCKHCYDYDYAENIDPFNFCPNCGAKMQKGGES